MSALNGTGVEKAFEEITNKLVEKAEKSQNKGQKQEGMTLSGKGEGKKGGKGQSKIGKKDKCEC